MEERRSNLTSLIGMMLMTIVLIFFFYRNQSTAEQVNNTPQTTDSSQPQNTPDPQAMTSLPTDSLGLSKYKEKLGAFAYSATLPSAKEGAVTTLENSLLKLQVSNKGGQITSLLVKNQNLSKITMPLSPWRLPLRITVP